MKPEFNSRQVHISTAARFLQQYEDRYHKVKCVRKNERAYSHIEQRGKFGTRYGMGDKIEIFNGDPRFDF